MARLLGCGLPKSWPRAHAPATSRAWLATCRPEYRFPKRKVETVRLSRSIIPVICLAACGLFSAVATAQTGQYTQLQVLLPGESPAPGTASGKTGVPSAQAVGVPFTVSVRACDQQWNPVASVANVVGLTSSDAVADLPGNTALSAGAAALTVTLNAVGAFTFSADDQSDPTVPTATSSLVQTSVLQGFVFRNITQKHVDAGVPFATDIKAVNPAGNVVTGFNGQVNLQELTSFGVGRIEPAVVTLSNGIWAGNVTVFRADETNISSGNVNMYAFLAADPTRNGTSNPFVVHPGNLSRVQIVVPGQDPLPGSSSGLTGSPATQSATQPFSVEIYATDSWWNPLSASNQVRITSSDAGASTPVTISLSGGTGQTTLSLATVGAQTLTVADQSGSLQGMTTAQIPVIAAGAHHFVIAPLPDGITAGDAVPVTIRASDAGGNTLPTYAGNAILTANTGVASISPEQITFSGGIWNGTITFRGAGNAVQFACSDYATPPNTGLSGAFVVAPGPYVGLQVLLPGQMPRGGTQLGYEGEAAVQAAGTAFDLVVRAVDLYFNRVPNITCAVSFTSTDENLSVPVDVNLANGEAIVPVTVYRAGGQTVSATDADSSGVAVGTSTLLKVTAGTYARLLLIAPGEHVSPGSAEGRGGEATDQSINYAFTVTVHATDNWFNPVGGVNDVVVLTSNDPMAELPGGTALLDGTAQLSVRLSTGGYQQITAANVSRPTMTPSTTQVNMISSGFHLEAVMSPTTVQAGSPFSLTVKVTNDAGSVIQEINTAVTIEVRNASTQEPGRGELANSSFQLLQGQWTETETYTFAEDIVLVVTDQSGNTPAVTGVLTVLPGAPARLLVSSDPAWVRANRAALVSARVVDTFGNGVPDRPVVFSQSSEKGVLTARADSTDAEGFTHADYLSPREPGVETISVASGQLTGTVDIETALVDPNAAGGTLTNYPNPFHPDEAPTTIAYVLDDDASVRIRIYTLSGGLVYEAQYAAGGQGGLGGLNEITWNGRNGDGNAVASGGYILFIEAEGGGTTMHVMRHKIGVVW